MIPEITYAPEVLQELEVVRQPSLGWGIDFENKRICGFIDEIESVKQAIYLILSTERYSKEIYTWNHGIETHDLYQSNKYLIIPQLQKRIMDALYQDDRITDISNFKVDVEGTIYHVTLDVTTIFGETISIESEVII